MARRSKDGSIIINVGSDAQRHLDRVAKRERIASERAAKREAKKAATRERQALRQTGKRGAQMARAIQRQRDAAARRKAAREARKNWRPDPNREKRKKRPFHPRGPNATEKYTSYARRLERSRKLRASRTSPTTFTCNGYTIKVTPGSDPKPLSWNWLGSKAGPFNPCKHMMAVRDLAKWKCVGGVCIKAADGTYNSQAECEAALVPATFTGGQCVGLAYRIQVAVTFGDGTFYGTLINGLIQQSVTPLTDVQMRASGKNFAGPISSVDFGTVQYNGTYVRVNGIENDGTSNGFALARSFNTLLPLSISVVRIITFDGSADNCGNPPPTCP